VLPVPIAKVSNYKIFGKALPLVPKAESASVGAQSASVGAQSASVGAQSASVGAQSASVGAQSASVGAQSASVNFNLFYRLKLTAGPFNQGTRQ
jgi:hypothetical protein